MISVDGTDFRVAESGSEFYSFKYKKSGLRYEIGLCMLTGEIVWLNGPYECGMWNDIQIFRDSLLSHLEEGELVEADDGYVGAAPAHVKCPASFVNPEETLYMQQRIRNRQETVNKRLKNWGILKQVYRHEFSRHGEYTRACLVVTHLSIKNSGPIFDCGHHDPPYDINSRTSVNGECESDNDDGLSYDTMMSL